MPGPRSTIVLLALLAVPGILPAGSLTVSVVDGEGLAVRGAVVWLEPRDGRAPAPVPHMAVMDQVDSTFVPGVLVVARGSAVEFPNSDEIRHHVYSFSRPNDFELPLYAGRMHGPTTFDHPGLVVLGCNIHDNMAGYIYVVDTPWFGKTGPDGKQRFEDVPAGAYRVVSWSSRQRNIAATTEHALAMGTQRTSLTVAIEHRMRSRRFTQTRDPAWDDY